MVSQVRPVVSGFSVGAGRSGVQALLPARSRVSAVQVVPTRRDVVRDLTQETHLQGQVRVHEAQGHRSVPVATGRSL